MTLIRLLTQLTLAAGALATPLYGRDGNNNNNNNNSTSHGIKWGPCDYDTQGSGPIQCATLAVPLDYTNPASSEKLALSLLRSPSRSKNRKAKKTILFNFGGPGYEAVHTLNALADVLHLNTGGEHDLVAFDPRGVAETIPFSCFSSPAERALALAKYPILPVDAYDTALAETYANSQAWNNICKEKNNGNQNPEFIGTSFVVRDLMSIVDALGEDGLLRFWGFSYGSLLGATAAAMFPSRMGRVILDGVVNARNYYHRFGVDVDQLLSADDAFRAILAACIEAGPEKCALAPVSSNAADLEAKLLSVADEYGKSPVAAGTTVINKRFVMELYFIVIKYTSDVANAAKLINNLVTGTNLTAVADYYNSLSEGISTGDNDSLLGIKCSDTFPRVDSLDGVRADAERMVETSRIFGPVLAAVTTQCASWPWKAKEMYDGLFEGIKTKSPILMFGNTYDPATPVVSAKNMSAGFEGSVVVEQRGFGHTTISQPSNCTAQIVQAFFNEGALPAAGTVCEVDTPLFG